MKKFPFLSKPYYIFLSVCLCVLFFIFMPDFSFLNQAHYKIFNPFVNFKNGQENISFFYPDHILVSHDLNEKIVSHSSHKPLEKTSGKPLRIVVLMNYGYYGEKNAAMRIVETMEKKNIEWAIVAHESYKLCQSRHIPVIRHLNPDLVISLHYENKPVTPYCNFLYVHSGEDVYFNKKRSIFPTLLQYDGFLFVGQYDRLKEYIKSQNHPCHHIHTFFSCAETPFTPLQYEKIFYCGGNWDKLRGGKKYAEIYKYLDQKGYLKVYGPGKAWAHSPSYGGFLPDGGDHFKRAIQENGVTLALHSQGHLKSNAPTSRIFEGVSASSLVICDSLPFAGENFGDSFLYIDEKGSAEEIYQAIEKHIKWARENPKQAKQKAQKAHNIFIKKYTLEKEIEKILSLHKKINGTSSEKP
jgi:hypothetical protein